MQQPRWSWSTVAIVTATVALVFGPVFVPREVSRWYLAAAANAYRVGDQAAAAQYIDRAVRWEPGIIFDGDYWIAQMSRSQTPDQVLDLLETAIKVDPGSSDVAIKMSQTLADEFEFERAVRAFKMAYPSGQPSTANDLNSLAYLRAQAGIELDKALKDINRAIELTGPDPALLDTKAWVLHKMHRDLEALGILNEAIEKLEKQLGNKKTEPPKSEPTSDTAAGDDAGAVSSEAKSQDVGQPLESLSETAQLRKQIQVAQARLGLKLWSLAVLRFHRLRIYEALQQLDEAEGERQWLKGHGVPIVDELF